MHNADPNLDATAFDDYGDSMDLESTRFNVTVTPQNVETVAPPEDLDSTVALFAAGSDDHVVGELPTCQREKYSDYNDSMISFLQIESQSATATNLELYAEKKKLEEELATVTQENRAHKRDLAEFEQQLAAGKTTYIKLVEAMQEKDEAHAQELRVAREETDALVEQARLATNLELYAEKKKLEEELATVTQENRAHKRDLAEFEHQLAAGKTTYIKLVEAMQEKDEAHAQELRVAREESAATLERAQLDAASAREDSVKLQELLTTLPHLQAQLDTLKSTNQNLIEAAKAMEAAHAEELRVAREKTDALREQALLDVASIREECLKVNSEYENLSKSAEANVAKCEKVTAELEALREQHEMSLKQAELVIGQLNDQLREKDAEIQHRAAALKQQLKTAEESNAELEQRLIEQAASTEQEIEALRQKHDLTIKHAEYSIGQLQDELRQKNATPEPGAALQQQLMAVEAQNTELKQQLADQKAELAAANEEVERLGSALDEVDDIEAKLLKEIGELRQQLGGSKETQHSSPGLLAVLKDRIQALSPLRTSPVHSPIEHGNEQPRTPIANKTMGTMEMTKLNTPARNTAGSPSQPKQECTQQ
ncbi:unnamed protein product, partial [Mesorhabditis spiculigera]